MPDAPSRLPGSTQGLPALETLLLVGNSIGTLEKDSIPRTLKKIHLGSNQLRHLNGTLR